MSETLDTVGRLADRVRHLERALELIGWECDPADPEWSDPAAGRKFVFVVACEALGREPQCVDDHWPHPTRSVLREERTSRE